MKRSISAWLAVSFAHLSFLNLIDNFPLNAPELLTCKDAIVPRLATFIHAELNGPATLSISTALAMSHAIAEVYPAVMVELKRIPLDGTTQQSSMLRELLTQGRSDQVMLTLWRKMMGSTDYGKDDFHDISGILTTKRPQTEGSMRSLKLSSVAERIIPGKKFPNRSIKDDFSFNVHSYRETSEFVSIEGGKIRAQSAPAKAARTQRKRRFDLPWSGEVVGISADDQWIPANKVDTSVNVPNIGPATFDSELANDKLTQRLNKTLDLSKNGSFTTYLQNYDMFGNQRRIPMTSSNLTVLPDMSVELYERKEELGRDLRWKRRLWKTYRK